MPGTQKNNSGKNEHGQGITLAVLPMTYSLVGSLRYSVIREMKKNRCVPVKSGEVEGPTLIYCATVK